MQCCNVLISIRPQKHRNSTIHPQQQTYGNFNSNEWHPVGNDGIFNALHVWMMTENKYSSIIAVMQALGRLSVYWVSDKHCLKETLHAISIWTPPCKWEWYLDMYCTLNVVMLWICTVSPHDVEHSLVVLMSWNIVCKYWGFEPDLAINPEVVAHDSKYILYPATHIVSKCTL